MVCVCAAFAALLASFAVLQQHRPRRSVSARNACIANLKQLEGAKSMWALEQGKGTNDVPAWSEIIGETNYISVKPMCPKNGNYTLGAVRAVPGCSIPGHVLP